MHRTLVRSSLLVLLSVAVLFAVAQAQPPQKSKSTKSGAAMTYGNAESITEEEMKVYDYFLASDQLEGRNLPSRGYDTAALYVASHLAEWKLKPGGSTSGTNGPLQPYLMPWELVTRQIVSDGTKASITAPAPAGRGGAGGGGGGGGRGGAPGAPRTTDFEMGKDWTVTPGGAGFRSTNPMETLDVNANLVFAGNGYVVPKSNANPYEGLDVKGKIVVVAGLPPELAALQAQLAAGRGGRGGPIQNPLGVNCTDYWTPEEAAAKNGAVAVVNIANFQQVSALVNPPAGRGPAINGPAYQVVKFAAPLPCPSVPSITAGLGMTNAIFVGEKMNAAAVFYGAGANTKMDSFPLNANKTLALHVIGKNDQGHGENVVGILEGSDPVLKNEFVIISAHLDHIGLSAPQPDGHTVNNGADDDGSGSTGLLGIARAYAEGAAKGMRPKRTIIFLWNGGEERGLWGSRYFAQFPPVDITKVVANLNMDMIGRTKNPNSVDNDPTHRIVDPGGIMIVGPRVSSDDMQKTIEAVNNNYQKLKLDDFYDTTAPDATHDSAGPQPNGQRIFYRSDHYNFAKVGVPIVFFTTGLHVDYHRPTDTPEKIDYHEIQVVSKTVAAVGWVLANQAGRPQLKADLPALLVQDMKDAKDQGWGKLTPVLPPLPGMPY
jgi:hypothetical protein